MDSPNHSFSFSSRWHRSTRKGPYALHPVSQQSPQGCPRNNANICLIEHRSFSTLDRGMSAASFLHSSFLQAINAVMLWPVHVHKSQRSLSERSDSSRCPSIPICTRPGPPHRWPCGKASGSRAGDAGIEPLLRPVGLVVKAAATRAADPGFEFRLRRDFYWLSHTSGLKNGARVATLPGPWSYRVRTGTSRPVLVYCDLVR